MRSLLAAFLATVALAAVVYALGSALGTGLFVGSVSLSGIVHGTWRAQAISIARAR